MSELFASPYFGVGLSVIAFGIGVKLNRKLKTPVCNPLIVAIVIVSGVLLIFGIPYESYNVGGEIINMFLAPATACLAAAIYTRINILKEYWLPILAGCAAGSAASMASVYGMCRLFGLDDSLLFSMLPKSVTYALSSDDETWREFGRVEFPEDQSVQVKFVPARVESPQPVRARYIRVSVEGTKICPSWHYGVGCPCWFFIDEVSVF